MNRRGFMACMAWAGSALVWSMHGGESAAAQTSSGGDFRFVQISDSHIGFDKAANPDVKGTFAAAIASVNAMKPDFVVHTGDITHLSRPAEFDAARQILSGCTAGQIFYVPGEHDVLDDGKKLYFEYFGRRSTGGWYSFDHKGVHFVALINVMELQPGGGGFLGRDQIEWLRKDLASVRNSTPVVVFAHMPMWPVYPSWGWGTDDAEAALALLKRFGSVTVLNGHIHQILRKVEGTVTMHTAASTAYPQPAPGAAPAPGPLKVESSALASVLGVTDVRCVASPGSVAVVDRSLVGVTR